jgi:hypothetical protein
MIGRLVHFEGPQAAIANLERGLLDDCMAALRALPGLAGLHAMVDRAKGKAVVLAIWQDTKSADGAMDAMVPIRHVIIDGGIRQSMSDYEIIT